MAKFLVSILAHNRVAGTRECVEAVLDAGGDFILRLTDNGSTDGTADYFRSLVERDSRVRVCLSNTNEGFQGPNERALSEARDLFECPYLVLLNDDTRPPVGWLERLVQPLEMDPGCAIAGAAGGCCEITANFHGTGSNRVEYIEGSCLMAKISALAKIRTTLFDPNLTFMYGEDADLSLEVRRAGYRIAQVPINIQHIGAASRLANPQLKARCEEAERQNHKYLIRKWAHYLKVRRFDHRIVIRRKAAHGDVLLVTPLVRAVRKQYPLCPIMVETNVPEVLYGNPCITATMPKVHPHFEDLVIDLDMASENGAMRHFVSSYFSAAPPDLPRPAQYRTEIYYDKRWAPPAPGKWCALHVGPTTWKAKNWPYDRWDKVERYLSGNGWRVVLVGNGDQGINGCTLDLRNKTSIKEMAAVIDHCDLFIGVDSFPMHVAQAVGTPTIGIFGITEGKYILTDGSPSISCDADPILAPRAGERHRVTGACYIDEDGTTIRTVTVDQVLAAVDRLYPKL